MCLLLIGLCLTRNKTTSKSGIKKKYRGDRGLLVKRSHAAHQHTNKDIIIILCPFDVLQNRREDWQVRQKCKSFGSENIVMNDISSSTEQYYLS